MVSRETSLSPRETAVMPPTPVRQRMLSLSDCRASPTDGTRSVPPEADVSATFFRGSRTPYPVGHDVFYGRPLPGTGKRHHVAPHVLRHTPYLPPRRERPSRLIQQRGITASALGDVGRVSQNIAVGRFTIGFT